MGGWVAFVNTAGSIQFQSMRLQPHWRFFPLCISVYTHTKMGRLEEHDDGQTQNVHYFPAKVTLSQGLPPGAEKQMHPGLF